MTDPTGRPADAEPVTPDPEQAVPNAPGGWASEAPAPEEPAPPSDPAAAPEPMSEPAQVEVEAASPPPEPTPEPAPVDIPAAAVPDGAAAAEPTRAPADTPPAAVPDGAVAVESPSPAPPDTPPAVVPDVADGNGPEPAPADDRRRRRLLAACASLVAISIALAVLAAVLASRLEGERGRRDAVEEVAGRFATALLTYNHENLDDAKERVLALSTGKFRREYEQAFANGLDTLIRETRATSAGTVTDIFVGEVEDDTASAIVVANAVSEGTTGTRRTVASYIQLELVRVGGQWRVDGVTNLNFGQGTTPTSTPE